MSKKLENLASHIERVTVLNAESFYEKNIDRNNLEDFRIHVQASLVVIAGILQDMEDQK